MNKVIIMGRLTKDPDISYSKDNTSIARFTLAVDRRFHKDNEQGADFIQCTAFGKTADFMEKYIRQGTKVVVDGEWRTGNYTNKDGQKIYTNTCMVNSVEFAESKSSSEKSNNRPLESDTGFMNIPDGIDEELPFA